MARRNPYRTTLVLGGLVGAAALGVWWSNRQIPNAVREERAARVLRSFRRDRVSAIEVQGRAGSFTLEKREGHWRLTTGGHSYNADETEAERLLTEAEYAQSVRRVNLDAASRERYGLAQPRARVTLREAEGAQVRFSVGGDVAEEETSYVEVEGQGIVAPRAFALAYLQEPSALRERNLSGLEPTRAVRVEVTREQGRTVFARDQGVWVLREPELGRVARLRMETLLNDLRDLRAARFLAEEATDAQLAQWGLAQPALTVRVAMERGPNHQWRVGGPCPEHPDELTILRGEGRSVACAPRGPLEALGLAAEQYRDDRLLWARPDEVDAVTVHAPAGEFTLRRDNTSWRLEGATGETDPESIDAWLATLGTYSLERRLPRGARADAGVTADGGAHGAAHGLDPARYWLEVRRTGVEGAERLEVGTPDADGMYVARPGEDSVLVFDPVTAEQLRIDAARFRSRTLLHDVPDQLALLRTEASDFSDEAQLTSGRWTLLQPAGLEADPSTVRAAAARLASLSAERWVSLEPEPRHGLGAPSLRVVARFEGTPPEAEHTDGGADVPPLPRTREYTLRVGAEAPGGGYYASLSERPGVFVLSSEAFRELAAPHAERTVLEFDRASVTALELLRPTGAEGGPSERLRFRREGTVWRTEAGAPADRVQVESLLTRLAQVRAPRLWGYGSAPATAQLGRFEVSVTAGLPGDAAAPQTLRVRIGASFGEGSEAGYYAEVPGRAVRTSVPRDVVDALRSFHP